MTSLDVIPANIRSRCAALMAIAAILYMMLRLSGLHEFLYEGPGVDALLQVIGTLFSVVYAFATYVIWGQFAAVENEILKESGALKDLILFSKRLKDMTRDPIVRAVKAYARGVVESEWAMLSKSEGTERTDQLFGAVVASVTNTKAGDDAERRVCERLLEIANQASAHRDERLALSVKRMPRTLLLFVTLNAWSILLLFFFFPFRNLVFGGAAIAIVTMLLFFAHFVLTDLDNPFEGTWNVPSKPFNDLATKYR